MNRFFSIVSVVAILFTAVVGCETSSKSDEPRPDSVSITAVNSVSNHLKVAVDYTLVSVDYGELEVGFNSGEDPTWYILVTNSTETVAAGTSNFEFYVDMTVSNWVQTVQPSVYVSLSVALHSIPWSPLADDTAEFNFTP